MDNKEILRKAFNEVFESSSANEESIAKFFDEKYQQWVDGNELDFKGFAKHVQSQKHRVEHVSFDFKSMVAEGDKVATIHHINAITKEGDSVKGRVCAQFTFSNGKIIRCEELTFFDQVKDKDKDLGHTQ